MSIRDKFGYLDEAVCCKHHPFKSVARRSAGTKSDDTQLTEAMMLSLLRCGGYNLTDIKKAHIEAADGRFGTPVGWGNSTRQAVENMRQGKYVTKITNGAGNGPVIKIAPLAIYCVYRCLDTPHHRFTNSFNHSLLKKCKDVSELTHDDPGCVVAAYCQCRMIIKALQDELPRESISLARMMLEDAIWAEEKVGGKLSDRLAEVFGWTADLGGRNLKAFDIETRVISAKICSEKSSYIYNSYPLVAYCVAKYLPYRNFRHAILETINAGADADSNASMVGAIMGALLALDEIPEQMIKSVKDWSKILANIRHFVRHL
jgi:ADP-ribosylglycohydrolase